jgi:sucrose-6-phosphatase
MLLLCTDLDRTILPNGMAAESLQARPLLHRLASLPDLRLAYVSGRDRSLLAEAVADYQLPRPHFAVGDVGTSIYTVHGDHWQACQEWEKEISADWQGRTGAELAGFLAGISGLRLQEAGRQNLYKLSYYTPEICDRETLLTQVHQRLRSQGIQAAVVWSLDEMRGQGLLDILPRSADKLGAVRFLMARLGLDPERVLFAGDSGNDIAVLTSGLKAILVRNADDRVRSEAQRYLAATEQLDRLYCARGGFLGMNGNYAAGVLEGVCHFFPEIGRLLAAAADSGATAA